MGTRYANSELVHTYSFALKVLLSHFNFVHETLVRFGNVIERKDSESQLEEEVRSEGHKGPEGDLRISVRNSQTRGSDARNALLVSVPPGP